jgi:hypothetical protein
MQVNYNGLDDLGVKTKNVVNDLVFELESNLPPNSNVVLTICSVTKRRTMFRATFKIFTKGQMFVAVEYADGLIETIRRARSVVLHRIEATKGRQLARRRDRVPAERIVS